MNFIFTTVYPNSKKYFNEFIESLNNQSNKNFKIFLILNGTSLNLKQKKKIENDHIIFKINTSWQNARIEGLKKLIKLKPKNIIFADSDDFFHKDRVKLSLNGIKDFDFLVHNCYLFKKKETDKEIWLKRKKGIIKLSHIKYKNFVGCSNTTVKAKALKKIIENININLIAFDWCIATLLLIKKFKGLYISKPLTYYRQYAENTSSLINVSKKKIKKDIKCKIEHYQYFEKFGINYKNKIIELKNKNIENKSFFSTVKKKFNKKNQYWWSII
jgi:hypothetical protein